MTPGRASCLFVYGIPLTPSLFTVLGMSINSGQRLMLSTVRLPSDILY